MNRIKLNELTGGQLQEKFDHAFYNVMQNMQDVNTPYKDKRKITIDLVFEQNEARDNVMVDVKVSEKLAGQSPVATRLYVGKDLQTGEIKFEEYGSQLRGQLTIDDTEEQPLAVDPETGEVIEPEKVLDFRKVKGE